MGKVIIKFKDNHLESFKCKSKIRAKEIADKRKGVIEWNFYEVGENIPKTRKIRKQAKEMTMQEMELLISKL